jgi:hypothetical protein
MGKEIYPSRDEAVMDNPPTISEMGEAASEIVWRVMGKGSDKSSYGEWFWKDKPTYDYHITRAIKHAVTAQQQIHLNHPCPDESGENALDHLERAVVRALFAWMQLKKGLPKI